MNHAAIESMSPHELQKEVVKAMDLLQNGVDPSPSESYPKEINERLMTVQSYVGGKLAGLPANVRDNTRRLINTALEAPSGRKKVFWLHKAANTFTKVYATLAACKPGCSHCCHIPVKLSELEAREIGAAIGRIPVPQQDHVALQATAYDNPCPFLVADQCSIYEHRPIVCKTHMNMDADDLLCRLSSGMETPVPFIDTRAFAMASILVAGEKSHWADIRQWFPVAGRSQSLKSPQGESA
jgi:Putative zinc- or iron-chelating domain